MENDGSFSMLLANWIGNERKHSEVIHMTEQAHDERPGKEHQPIAVVGAGPLTSHVWRVATSEHDHGYEFNVFCVRTEDGAVLQRFSSCQIRDFVKLCRVLASVILDDGWLSSEQSSELLELERELERMSCCRSTNE